MGSRTKDPRQTSKRHSQSGRDVVRKLPSSPFADDYLQQIAVLLRFMLKTSYLDERPLLPRSPRKDGARADAERCAAGSTTTPT